MNLAFDIIGLLESALRVEQLSEDQKASLRAACGALNSARVSTLGAGPKNELLWARDVIRQVREEDGLPEDAVEILESALQRLLLVKDYVATNPGKSAPKGKNLLKVVSVRDSKRADEINRAAAIAAGQRTNRGRWMIPPTDTLYKSKPSTDKRPEKLLPSLPLPRFIKCRLCKFPVVAGEDVCWQHLPG